MIRKTALYLKDKLIDGNLLKRTVKSLDDFYYSNGDPDYNGRLHKLTDHAVNTTKYYKSFKDLKKFDALPVLKKESIKENYPAFISTEFDIKKLFTGSTSGSTGSPMRFFYSPEKRKLRMAELIYFNKWAGYEVGMKYILNSIGSQKGKIKKILQNEILFDPSKLDVADLEDLRTLLLTKKIESYIGYPSVIKEIARHCQDAGDTAGNFNLKSIISTGEPLDEETRIIAEKVFGCTVLSRYASLEFGLLAQECPEEKKFHLNDVNYKIEVYEMEKDVPLKKPGKGRLIITDLNNFAFPLIKYEIGDLGEIDEKRCKCGRKGRILKSLDGRIVDSLIDAEGKRISFGHVNKLIWPFQDKIERFQCIQESLEHIHLKIQTKNRIESFEDVQEKLQSEFGSKIRVTIEVVDFIKAFNSGKKPFIVNKVLKNKLQENQNQ